MNSINRTPNFPLDSSAGGAWQCPVCSEWTRQATCPTCAHAAAAIGRTPEELVGAAVAYLEHQPEAIQEAVTATLSAVPNQQDPDVIETAIRALVPRLRRALAASGPAGLGTVVDNYITAALEGVGDDVEGIITAAQAQLVEASITPGARLPGELSGAVDTTPASNGEQNVPMWNARLDVQATLPGDTASKVPVMAGRAADV